MGKEKMVKLDNKEITLSEVQRQIKENKNPSKKIVEKSPGIYVTLNRLNG